MCLIYDRQTLLEFCYDGVMGIVDKGNCLEIVEGELKDHSCYYFSEWCPETKFWFYELYKYPACQNIITRYRCYISNVDCPTYASRQVSFGFWSVGTLIGICSLLFIPFTLFFLKAKRFLKGGKWSPQSPDLFSMEDDGKHPEDYISNLHTHIFYWSYCTRYNVRNGVSKDSMYP